MANTCNGSYSGPNVARAVQEKLQRLDSVDTNIRAVAGAFAGMLDLSLAAGHPNAAKFETLTGAPCLGS